MAILAAMLLVATSTARCAAITIVTFWTSSFKLVDGYYVPLTGGNPNVDHDGTVVQLGYHSNATVGQEFSGSWIPLTGEDGANSAYAGSTIGDTASTEGTGDGVFDDGWVFVLGNATRGMNLPPAGTPLAFRFYDGSSIASSFWFEEVSSPVWLWIDPTSGPFSPRIDMTISDAGVKRISGLPVSRFSPQISTAVPKGIFTPEPSTILMAAAGVLTLTARRRHGGSGR